MISVQTGIISQNSVNQLIFVMVKSCVFFAVRSEFRFERVNHHTMKTYGIVVMLPAFLSSVLDGGGWSISILAASPPWRVPVTNWIGGWVGPRAGLEVVNNDDDD
jgi:hypothetical protein